jgi:regulator of sigma E protease
VSWILALLGFMALVVLHELGHFLAAKAVGMRVERFSLFFPPFIWRKQGKGETEYTLGSIPLGGYVKISGMNPHEELPPEVQHRAYFRQKPWKRIVVILAGPLVNIVLAFVILTGLFLHVGKEGDGARVLSVERDQPAAAVLKEGDRIVTVDGRTGTSSELSDRIADHRCEKKLTAGCQAATPVTLEIVRDGETITERASPVYDAERKRMRLGFGVEGIREDQSVTGAAGDSLDEMWFVTDRTVTVIANIFDAEQRKQLSGVVGSYEATRQAINFDLERALYVLALISLSLGIVNLFPFLPLDGGHVFWAVAEKIRGRAIPFSVMERSGFIGFALVMVFFVVGFTNDIDRLFGEGFGPQR